jgi:hypothetical protein
MEDNIKTVSLAAGSSNKHFLDFSTFGCCATARRRNIAYENARFLFVRGRRAGSASALPRSLMKSPV